VQFRKLKTTNQNIQMHLLANEEIMNIMSMLGFQERVWLDE